MNSPSTFRSQPMQLCAAVRHSRLCPSCQGSATWQGAARVKLGFSVVRSAPAPRVGNTAGEDAVRAPGEEGTRSCAGPRGSPCVSCGLWSGCLCGLCFPPWGRGWTPLRPLLRDGLEHRGLADRGTGTASHPDTGTLPGLISSHGALCQRVGGRDHAETEQDSHAQCSIQAPAARAHTALPFCRVSGSPEVLAADRGLRWGGLEALSPAPA